MHTFNILALQQMGQHTDLFDATSEVRFGASRLQWWAFLLLFIGFVDQSAQRAGPHLVARCPRRSPDADLDDPGRRAA